MPLIEILVYIGTFLTLYFAIFVYLTFFENRKKVYIPDEEKNPPKVCLIIPCFNEEKNIGKTLNSLLALDYPKDKLEIIVVDDGSTDRTFQIAKSFQKKDARIRVFKKENGGKYTALNFGLERTKAQFVGSVDADSYLDPQALRKLMKHFRDKEVMAVISTIKIAQPQKILEGIQYSEYLIAAFLRKIFSFLGSVPVTPGPLSVFRTKVFETLGTWKEAHQTEDLEIAFRLQSKNFKIAHAIDSIVYTQPCSTLKSLFRQRLRWRRGFLLNLKDYPELLNIKKHGNFSFFLYCNILYIPLSIILVGYSFWKIGNLLFDKFNQLMLTGFDFSHFFSFNFNWFSINFKPSLLLAIFSTAAFFGYLFLSKKLTFDKIPIKEKAVFYLLINPFFNAFWSLGAIFCILFKKKISW